MIRLRVRLFFVAPWFCFSVFDWCQRSEFLHAIAFAWIAVFLYCHHPLFDSITHIGVSVGYGFIAMICIAEQVVFWLGLDGDQSADFG